jgi:hypothetical protein
MLNVAMGSLMGMGDCLPGFVRYGDDLLGGFLPAPQLVSLDNLDKSNAGTDH